jgi:hypothetical protein
LSREVCDNSRKASGEPLRRLKRCEGVERTERGEGGGKRRRAEEKQDDKAPLVMVTLYEAGIPCRERGERKRKEESGFPRPSFPRSSFPRLPLPCLTGTNILYTLCRIYSTTFTASTPRLGHLTRRRLLTSLLRLLLNLLDDGVFVVRGDEAVGTNFGVGPGLRGDGGERVSGGRKGKNGRDRRKEGHENAPSQSGTRP